jgi:multidrug resistance efflux pump
MQNNTEEVVKKSFIKKPWVQSILSIIVVFGLLVTFIYWQYSKSTVSIENSYLQAPISEVGDTIPGALNAIYVKDGDIVTSGQIVAIVGSETLYAKEDGTVTDSPLVLGGFYAPGKNIFSIIVNKKMRVIGAVDETKGLDKVTVGQHATFTVDTFGGKIYNGTVDEIGQSSNDTGVAFSISDKRPVKKFNVYVNFDTSLYPELKSGMSAKIIVKTNK